MDNETEAKKRGKAENGAEYRAYELVVTMPLSKDSLNLVSSDACFANFLMDSVENGALNIFNIVL